MKYRIIVQEKGQLEENLSGEIHDDIVDATEELVELYERLTGYPISEEALESVADDGWFFLDGKSYRIEHLEA